MMAEETMRQLIVFYDGECPFCVGWVKFLLDRDGHDRLRFASLQSEWTARFFEREGLGEPETGSLLAWDGLTLLQRSDAVRVIAAQLPGIWSLGRHIGLLPRDWRDGGYQFLARRRYRLFGRYNRCWLPEPGERSKFLDLEKSP